MQAQSVTFFENAAAGTSSAKVINGGKYSFLLDATGTGTCKLQVKLPNGTWFDVASGSLSANGYANFDLPAGEVRAIAATFTAIYCKLVKIPT